MEKDKYQSRIGENKVLTYHPDPSREIDQEFVQQFQQVAATHPESIQEFFIRLTAVQQHSVNQNIKAMNIELRNIKIYEKLSEETIAFSANIYINGVNAGQADNTGHGGPTSYGYNSAKGKKLLDEAEAYCQTLPAEVLHDTPSKGKTVTIQMNLENYIDNLVSAHQQKKYLEKFHKRMNKDQQYAIIFGIADQQYRKLKFPLPLTEMLKLPKGIAAIKKAIQEDIFPRLKDGEKILNTNLPEDFLILERRTPTKQLNQQDIPPNKNLGPKR